MIDHFQKLVMQKNSAFQAHFTKETPEIIAEGCCFYE